MPLYEYTCEKCGHDFEELVSGSAEVQCPACGSHATHKLISACARRSRGDGGDFSAPVSTGGCGSCMGGNCASCGH